MPEIDPGCRLLVRGPFVPGQVTTRVVASPRPTTPALEQHIESVWQATLERARQAGHRFFNGRVLRWVDGTVHESGARRELRLTVAPSTYREFVGTNLDPSLKPDFAGGTLPWSHFANAVGTSAVVVTRDGALVAGRRSARVLGYAGCVHAFGGMLEAAEAADGGAGPVDAFAELARELTEELGVRGDSILRPVLEGIILEPRIHQPEMIFHVHVDLALEELTERWRGAESGDEHDALVALAPSPADPELELRRVGDVSPIGRAALALFWSRSGS